MLTAGVNKGLKMSTENIQLQVKRGDSKSYALKFRTTDGVYVDITGWIIFFTVKENACQVDDDAIIQKDVIVHSNPTEGETNIELTPTDTDHTGNYVFDIQYKTNNGAVKTIIEGVITFEEDITRRTA